MVKVSGNSTRCHRAHDGTGAPATSWPATPRATDGLKQVMSATVGLTVNPGSWQVRGQSTRYRQKPAGTPGRTTKSSILESLIALPPAGSAFFSLVFFAEAKKSDRRPPQGDVVFLWVQHATTAQKKQRPTPREQSNRPLPETGGFVARPARRRASAGTGLTSHEPASFQAMQHRRGGETAFDFNPLSL